MSYKLFPHTKDGDQIRIVFDCMEEKSAFEVALRKLDREAKLFRVLCDEANDPGSLGHEISIPKNAAFDSGFNMWSLSYQSEGMFTTLEIEVIREKIDAVRAIFGFHVLNFGQLAFNFGLYKPMEVKDAQTKDAE